jgi:hypothetical protein
VSNEGDLPIKATYTRDNRTLIKKLECIFITLLAKIEKEPNFDLNMRDRYMDFFRRYLTSDYREINLSPLNEKRFNWLALRAQGGESWPLADIALRIEPTPCAEASCERVISAQRLLLTSKRMRTNPDLLNARLTLKTVLK